MRVPGSETSTNERPAGPFELLLAFHARIRDYIELSRTLAAADEASLREISETADAICRFFRSALPLHEADEEQTLFPRVLRLLPQGSLVHEAGLEMISQHNAIDEMTTELLAMCGVLPKEPELLSSMAHRLERVTSALWQTMAAHLVLEEFVIFPALRDLLSQQELEEMLQEMQRRRRPPQKGIHLVR